MISRICLQGCCALFALSAFCAAAPQAGERKQYYLHQSTIDSLIQTAFFGFNEAIELNGFDLHKRKAIDYAKWVVATLREKAKTDPNAAYINWKTGELEEQIMLESEDLILKKGRAQQKYNNTVIDSFNAEVTKKRPDFAALKKIYEHMAQLDPNKAGEMERLITQRRSIYSRVMPVRINREVGNDALQQARADVDYCWTNQEYLAIPPQSLVAIKATLDTKEKALADCKSIPVDLARCDNFIARHALGQFWKLYDGLGERLASAKSDCSEQQLSRYRLQLARLSAAAQRSEDSLVARNRALIASQGADKALDFCDYLRDQVGVSYEKLGAVREAVAAWEQQHPRKQSQAEQAMGETVRRITDTSSESTFSFSDLLAMARRKAQLRADSVRLVEERTRRAAQLSEIKTTTFLFFPKSPQQIESELKATEELAYHNVEAIYRLLERNDLKTASLTFAKLRRRLEAFTCRETFTTLEMTLKQAGGTVQSAGQ